MIQLPDNITPGTAALAKLLQYQQQVDAEPSFEKRSAKAKTSFSNQNKKGNAAFDEVKECLTAMCSGARRCVYCEDSVADEVEHIRPKNLYPGDCFKWENYVYACGNCNGPKKDKFAVFKDSDGLFTTVNPPKGTLATEPPAGDDVLINPRNENPLDYCILDIKDTFKFVVLPTNDAKKQQRAKYTFEEVLRLNDRTFLVEARRKVYENYKSRLVRYNTAKQNAAAPAKLNKIIQGIQTESHPTVWKEMQRYYSKGWLSQTGPELQELFTANPEAKDW